MSSATPALPSLSVVIPCYNEESSLIELHNRVSAVCHATTSNYEIVLVNDGSRDRTWPLMQQLSSQDAHLVVVDLSRNYGHQLALSAGLHVCTGHRILILDADLQDPPELLPEMMHLMDNGADVVYGQRKTREGESTSKLLFAGLFYQLIARLSDVSIPMNTGDFRLMRREVLDVLNSMPERSRFIRGMVSWVGFNQQPLSYERKPRFAGETKYPFRKSFKLALDAITAFSIKPLQIATYLGLLIGSLTSILAAYYLLSWMFGGKTVQGWLSLILAILFIGSAQLFVIGILGEYVGRIYLETKGRPMFVIRSIRRAGLPSSAQPTEKTSLLA